MQGAYDREPMSAPSKFLKLADKGDNVRLRILSEPFREPRVWVESTKKFIDRDQIGRFTQDDWIGILREPDYTVNEVYHWVVKDRSDNKIKIFSGTAGIYKKIKKYATTEDWGDPQMYDIVVTRTEQPGTNYYTVEAMPNKSTPTDEEFEQALTIDITKEIPIARLNSAPQLDDIDTTDQAVADNSSSDSGIDQISEEDIPSFQNF